MDHLIFSVLLLVELADRALVHLDLLVALVGERSVFDTKRVALVAVVRPSHLLILKAVEVAGPLGRLEASVTLNAEADRTLAEKGINSK